MPSAKPLPTIHPADALRFDGFVDQSGGPDACWPFTGGLVGGYGSFRLGKRKVRAHRVAWVLWSGEPEPTLEIDHVCHDPDVCPLEYDVCPHRSCCNPAHLRPATRRQQVANSNARSRQLAARTSCSAGHPWDEQNTRVGLTGWRYCRACQAATARGSRVRVGRPEDRPTCPHGHARSEWGALNLRGAKVCAACWPRNAKQPAPGSSWMPAA